MNVIFLIINIMTRVLIIISLFYITICNAQEKKIRLYFYDCPTNNYLHFRASETSALYQITMQRYFNNFGFSIQYRINDKFYIRSGITDKKQKFDMSLHPYNLHRWNAFYYNGYPYTGQEGEIRYWGIPLLLSVKMNNIKKLSIFHSVGITTDIYYCNYNGYVTYVDTIAWTTPYFWNRGAYTDNIQQSLNKQTINATFSVQADMLLLKNAGISVEAVFNYGVMNFFKDTKRSNIISFEIKAGIFIQ
ncbi:MAG: hypothetical protein A2X08_06660 [Bacteroidetes bacterium GWA2_32_17]|nr:MAG: hypothetical protein A2X08_06660 [Bacteroidetes bacterium GWA2_32_17]